MGKRKVLLPAAMLLSALSALAGMLPYILNLADCERTA